MRVVTLPTKMLTNLLFDVIELKAAKDLKKDFLASVIWLFTEILHKILKDISLSETVNRLPIIVLGRGIDQYLAMPKLQSGTGWGADTRRGGMGSMPLQISKLYTDIIWLNPKKKGFRRTDAFFHYGPSLQINVLDAPGNRWGNSFCC